jgi:hypothetical protein
MRANADVSPLAFDRPAASQGSPAMNFNAGRAGRRPRTSELLPRGGSTLRPDHVAPDPAIHLARAEHCWRSYSPTSLVRTPPRFINEDDRQQYRQGIRRLALVYAGVLVLLVAITALRGDWSSQNVSAKATTGASDLPRRH